jgi:hypothetical protein
MAQAKKSRKCPNCGARFVKYTAFVKHWYAKHYKSKAKVAKQKTGPWKAPRVHKQKH